MDVEKVDKNGLRWVTEGYLYTSIVIAKDDERKEIMDLIDKQIKICNLQIANEKMEQVKSLWVVRKKVFEDVYAIIKRRCVE